MPRHKHADVIIAWANGEEIQYKGSFGAWTDWQMDGRMGPTFHPDAEYRIKPKIVKREGWLNVYQKDSRLSKSKEEADACAGSKRVACIRIEWEEEV